MTSYFRSKDFTQRWRFAALFSAIYVLHFGLIVGWQPQHLSLLLVIVGCTLIHRWGYRFILAATGLIGWVMLYDSMRFLPNHAVSPVHLKDLYDLEVSLFGVQLDGVKVSLCQWFAAHLNDALSLFSGGSYLLWVPAPLAFMVYLMVKDPKAMVRFTWAYFLVNVIGVILYYLYPAAPPWYYLTYGDIVDHSVIGSEALLSEFDRLIGYPIFHGIYVNSTNIFGAIPSLHCAYPTIAGLYAWKYRRRGWTIFFIIMAIGTYLGAVYSQHHYVIDVLLGILCAILTFVIMGRIIMTGWWQRLESWYLRQGRLETFA